MKEKRKKTQHNKNLRRPVESFKRDQDIAYYYGNCEKFGFRSKTELVNMSIRLMIKFKNNPEEVLRVLKMRNQKLYKKVGRIKFL